MATGARLGWTCPRGRRLHSSSRGEFPRRVCRLADTTTVTAVDSPKFDKSRSRVLGRLFLFRLVLDEPHSVCPMLVVVKLEFAFHTRFEFTSSSTFSVCQRQAKESEVQRQVWIGGAETGENNRGRRALPRAASICKSVHLLCKKPARTCLDRSSSKIVLSPNNSWTIEYGTLYRKWASGLDFSPRAEGRTGGLLSPYIAVLCCPVLGVSVLMVR